MRGRSIILAMAAVTCLGLSAASAFGEDRPRRVLVCESTRPSTTRGVAVGAVAGGVMGNAVAGRGNRTAGTVVGAGLGGLAGQGIARSQNQNNQQCRYEYQYL
jgi:uncharacterized protein YcfJ